MLIGITYDLKVEYLAKGLSDEETAELDSEDTINAIVEALKKQGHAVEKIGGISSLVLALSNNKKWDLVFNIAEGLKGFSREARIPALLDAYDIPYTFSDPLTLTMCLHKGITKKIIRDAGLKTPKFVVIEDINDIEDINFAPPYFIKPIAEGTSKGIDYTSIINYRDDLFTHVNLMLEKYKQPVLIEELMIGREFTVGIIGTGKQAKAIGTIEIIVDKSKIAEGYSYEAKQKYLETVRYVRVEEDIALRCQELAIKAWRALGGRDCGRIDIMLDSNDEPNFIEANPLAGLNPVHSDLPILAKLYGYSYENLINMIVESASKRIVIRQD
jgi:D-alanine-D-alanine ligase